MLLAASLLLGGITILGIAAGHMSYEWYPQITAPKAGLLTICTYIAYALLALIPSYLQLKEDSRWRSLQSEI